MINEDIFKTRHATNSVEKNYLNLFQDKFRHF